MHSTQEVQRSLRLLDHFKYTKEGIYLRFLIVLILLLTLNSRTDDVKAEEYPVVDLHTIDTNNDFLLESPISVGTVLFRPHDGVTQIREGQYVVPNNAFFVDSDGDGVLDQEPVRAALVVVVNDNLTWLYERDEQGNITDKAIGVFPNGTGRPGANTVTSLRVIDKVLGQSWGESESLRLGFADSAGNPVNAYGSKTLGTSYYISASETAHTAQEVHGTHSGWEYLLGTEISGGCTRHRNQDIEKIVQRVRIGELVATVETAIDDDIDNPFTLYNTTQVAARRRQATIPTELYAQQSQVIIPSPSEYLPLPVLELSRGYQWVTWEQARLLFGDRANSLVRVAHPYTRGEYSVIPCGSETFFLASVYSGQELVRFDGQTYTFSQSPTITLPNDQHIQMNNLSVTPEQLREYASRLSSGDERLQAFQYLAAAATYQTAQAYGNNLDVTSLSDIQIRNVQLATGLIPFRYSWRGLPYTNPPGDFLVVLQNRTLIHSMVKSFGGEPHVYELHTNNNAYKVIDQRINYPSVDHEMVSAGEERQAADTLLREAVLSNKRIILRVTSFAAFTEPIRYSIGLSNNHYFVVVPYLSSQEHIVIQDTMHPSRLLIISYETAVKTFSTATIW